MNFYKLFVSRREDNDFVVRMMHILWHLGKATAGNSSVEHACHYESCVLLLL